MTELPRLIIDAQTRALALKTAADDFVGWLNNLRADIAKCEEELEQKLRIADQQTARLQTEIQRLQSERAKEEQALAQVRKDLERERREIGLEKERFLKSLDPFGPQAA